MKYVKKIADVNKQKRRDAILSILAEHKIPFRLCGQQQNKHFTENIIVSVNPQKQRYVIGAHYDNVEGSIGAVDNASGVSTVLKLLFALYGNTDKPVDFVFFDREEYEDRGSEAYVNSVGKENIIAMLNLDPCGFGDTIAIHKMYDKNVNWFDNLFDKKHFLDFPLTKINFTPNGDHYTFFGNNIPTIEICTVSEKLAICFNKIAPYRECGEVPKELYDEFLESYDMTTFHNGENDKLETVSQTIMDSLTQYLINVLK